MKLLLPLMIVGSCLGCVSKVNATFLTSSDYSSIEITPPEGWVVAQSEIIRLVDGDTSTPNPGTGRFVGRKLSGEQLSVDNPYSIKLNLAKTFGISSILLFNDWGNFFTHSVGSLSLSAFDENQQLLYKSNLSNLATPGSFAPIGLFNGELLGVQSLQFDVTSTNAGSSFELREIRLDGFALASSTQVSAPASLGLLAVACMFLIRKRRKL